VIQRRTKAPHLGEGPFLFRHTGAASRGIAAIELVVVIGATVLMGAVCASAFHTYTVRSNVAAALAMADGTQRSVADAFRELGMPPPDRSAAGLPYEAPTGEYGETLDVVDGRIDIRFGDDAAMAIAGRTLSLTPFETVSLEIVWVCGNRIPGVGLEPLGFAGGSRRASQVVTTIDARYLPPSCR
jgi:hypothetical protein